MFLELFITDASESRNVFYIEGAIRTSKGPTSSSVSMREPGPARSMNNTDTTINKVS